MSLTEPTVHQIAAQVDAERDQLLLELTVDVLRAVPELAQAPTGSLIECVDAVAATVLHAAGGQLDPATLVWATRSLRDLPDVPAGALARVVQLIAHATMREVTRRGMDEGVVDRALLAAHRSSWEAATEAARLLFDVEGPHT